jgi:NAD(P)-dependent dehydrogenase (short-subunit alcohol dehydrogenase family)
MLSLLGGGVVIGVAALAGAAKLLEDRRRFSFKNKVVLITGGSRGLGLLLSRRVLAEGAKLVIAARNQEELQNAQSELRHISGNVRTVVCDIADKEQCRMLIRETLATFGPVDVLINDAGVIQVGPLDSMTLADYEEAMNIHYWGPLNLILSVLPLMRERRFGRIVNISSIGGLVSVPHLVPYCASKFALTGLSEGLRAELIKDGVYVTTVWPGLMRTGSHVNAYFKSRNRKEYAWFSIFNALPFSSINADKAADQIIEACRTGQAALVINIPAQLLSKFHGIFPGLTADIMGVMNSVLPKMGGIGTDRVTGKASQSIIAPSVLTVLADKQVARNNEGS